MSNRPVRTHDDTVKIVFAFAALPTFCWAMTRPMPPADRAVYLLALCGCVAFIVYKFRTTSAPLPLQPNTPEARMMRVRQRGFFEALMGRRNK
jgi:hypothetical protein